MGTDKRFKKMRELITALAEAERNMEAGTLGHEGLEQAAIHARELYERLVILRHRSREAKISGRQAPAKQHNAPDDLAKEMDAIANVAGEPTPAPMRLDTRPHEISPRQTSLIEAIEQTKQPEEETAKPQTEKMEKTPAPVKTTSAKETEKPKDKPASLAEKLNKSAIPSLGKTISLSHKFWFVSELYNGDRIFYEKSIEKLDNMGDRAEAELFIQKEVIARLKKPADPEALNTFMELIERRFQ